jgi:hypothetical protein
MTGEERERRDSRALDSELITDPQAKAAAEASNGFRQYDAAIGTIQKALEHGSFKLRPSLILGLQRDALVGIGSYAGNYRPGGVAIEGSKHEPVGAHLVLELIEDMCDYVNDNWETSTPIHLAAYLMWRLNWIIHLTYPRRKSFLRHYWLINLQDSIEPLAANFLNEIRLHV